MFWLNQLSASALVAGTAPAALARLAKASLADFWTFCSRSKLKPSNRSRRSAPFDRVCRPGLDVCGEAVNVPFAVWMPLINCDRNVPNSSCPSWPSLLASNDLIRFLARSWTAVADVACTELMVSRASRERRPPLLHSLEQARVPRTSLVRCGRHSWPSRMSRFPS